VNQKLSTNSMIFYSYLTSILKNQFVHRKLEKYIACLTKFITKLQKLPLQLCNFRLCSLHGTFNGQFLKSLNFCVLFVVFITFIFLKFEKIDKYIIQHIIKFSYKFKLIWKNIQYCTFIRRYNSNFVFIFWLVWWFFHLFRKYIEKSLNQCFFDVLKEFN
jgi:hypothetical protein